MKRTRITRLFLVPDPDPIAFPFVPLTPDPCPHESLRRRLGRHPPRASRLAAARAAGTTAGAGASEALGNAPRRPVGGGAAGAAGRGLRGGEPHRRARRPHRVDASADEAAARAEPRTALAGARGARAAGLPGGAFHRRRVDRARPPGGERRLGLGKTAICQRRSPAPSSGWRASSPPTRSRRPRRGRTRAAAWMRARRSSPSRRSPTAHAGWCAHCWGGRMGWR